MMKFFFCFFLGINPTELKGRKIGVFVAVCDIDSECDVSQRLDNIELSFNNNLRCMLANRLSFFLDVKGNICIYLFMLEFFLLA